MGAGVRGIMRRGKYEFTLTSGLALEEAERRSVERNCTLTGLAVAEHQHISVDFRPAQLEDFALAASGEQEQPNDVYLLPSFDSFPGVFVKGAMQTPKFVPRQKASESDATVGPDAMHRGGADVAAGHREVQNPAEDTECEVGAARGGLAVGVELEQHLIAGDVMKRC